MSERDKLAEEWKDQIAPALQTDYHRLMHAESFKAGYDAHAERVKDLQAERDGAEDAAVKAALLLAAERERVKGLVEAAEDALHTLLYTETDEPGWSQGSVNLLQEALSAYRAHIGGNKE